MVQNPMQPRPRPEPEGPRFPAFAIPPPNPPTREFPEGQETGLMSDIPIDAIVGVLNGDEGTDRVYLAGEVVSLFSSGNFRNPFTRAPITNVTWYRARRREDVQEVTIPMAPPEDEGSARPSTFQYSRDDLTTNQKAAERAAYYRKNPAENPKNKAKAAAKASENQLKEEQRKKVESNKAKWAKEAEEADARKKEIEIDDLNKPLDEPQASLADRAKITRAKATLKKGILRKLLRQSAENRLWIYLYKKGGYLPSPELSAREYKSYNLGRFITSKADWDAARNQTYEISVGKWQDYLPQSTYDRIAKQIKPLKERLEKENEKMIENGPSPDRKKKLPEQEGMERMVTPNGYEWYVEDGKVFDLNGVKVGHKGMAAFKNLKEI
jgi:hypothetical protein